MRKIKALFMVLLAAVIFTGCTKTVEIYFPSDFFGEDAESLTEELKGAEGIKRITVHDDNSVTMKVTEEKYNKQIATTKQMIDETYATVGEEGGFFKTVKGLSYDEECTKLTFEVDRKAFEASNEGENLEQVIYLSRLYQVYLLETEREIEVSYMDSETGEVYKTDKYNASGKITEN